MNNRNDDAMKKFDFLIGNWKLDYKIPKSIFSEAATGSGTGRFQRIYHDRYVTFEYTSSINNNVSQAHGIFVWDQKTRLYRYWWFEDSGNFMTATCNFVKDGLLLMNWHDSILKQSFSRIDANHVLLLMEHPDSEGRYVPVLEVRFKRQG